MAGALAMLVERLAEALLAGGYRVAVAESCTGGGIARAMTDLPGSSRWFERGFVTYSNDAKREMLGVSPVTIREYGAVSVETAAEMAEGALGHSHAQLSVAVTGVAGPDGGSDEKPVGTVCFAWSLGPGHTLTARTLFPGDRGAVREQAVLMAIQTDPGSQGPAGPPRNSTAPIAATTNSSPASANCHTARIQPP